MVEKIDCDKYLLNWKKKAEFAHNFVLFNGLLALFSFLGSYFHMLYSTTTAYTPIAMILFIITGCLFSLGTTGYIRAITLFLKLPKTFEKEDLKLDDLTKIEGNWNKIIQPSKILNLLGFFLMLISLNVSIMAFSPELGLFSILLIWPLFISLIRLIISWKDSSFKIN